MVLELIRKSDGAPAGRLAPEDEAALRAVKRGEGDTEDHKVFHSVVERVRAGKFWIRCDCLGEREEQPIIVPTRRRFDRFSLVNRPHASVQHAEWCEFGLVGDIQKTAGLGTSADVLPGDILDPFESHERHTDWIDLLAEPAFYRESSGASTGHQKQRMSRILRTLTEAARLNTHTGVEGFRSQAEWLARIETAAQSFHLAPDLPASELLFTDPASWSSGEVAGRLDDLEKRWPRRRTPFALLCWIAHDVQDCEINRDNPKAGYIRSASDVVCPIIGRERVPGPWLFLGAVSRPPGGGPWACRKACAQPIVSLESPVPVDSRPERRAWEKLCHLVAALRNDEELLAVLGGPVQVVFEKPLFRIPVEGGPCLPDFLVTVTRSGEHGGWPQNGPYTANHMVCYVIEVMGFDTPEYHERKKRTHSRMYRIGQVFTMDAQQFDSRFNSLERQCERITERIRKSLLRWCGGVWQWD